MARGRSKPFLLSPPRVADWDKNMGHWVRALEPQEPNSAADLVRELDREAHCRLQQTMTLTIQSPRSASTRDKPKEIAARYSTRVRYVEMAILFFEAKAASMKRDDALREAAKPFRDTTRTVERALKAVKGHPELMAKIKRLVARKAPAKR
jgi:hypothetical protein